MKAEREPRELEEPIEIVETTQTKCGNCGRLLFRTDDGELYCATEAIIYEGD